VRTSRSTLPIFIRLARLIGPFLTVVTLAAFIFDMVFKPFGK
jgi:hypothetical protein